MKELDRVHDKLDKIDDTLSEINKTLARNTTSLELHIRRTNLLESELKPIKKKVNMAEGAFKVLGSLMAISGLILSIYQTFK